MEPLVHNTKENYVYRDGHWQEDESKVDETIVLIFRWLANLSSQFGTEKSVLSIIPAINEVVANHNSIGIAEVAYIARPGHWAEWQYRLSLTLCPGRKYAEITPDILKNLEFHTHRESL